MSTGGLDLNAYRLKVINNIYGQHTCKPQSSEYADCLFYREAFYELQQPVVDFLECAFQNLAQYLIRQSASDRSVWKDYCASKFRTFDGRDSDRFMLEKRKRFLDIDTLNWKALTTFFSTDYIAKCRFPSSVDISTKDPLATITVIQNCSLFDDKLFICARSVIKDRNEFLAHSINLRMTTGQFQTADDNCQYLHKAISCPEVQQTIISTF